MAGEKADALQPYFQLQIPAILDVMAALVSSFVVGIGIAYTDSPTLKKGFAEFRTIIEKTIQAVIIPLLPLYIFGIFIGMTFTGEAYHIIVVFAKIICIIFLLHIIILLYEFLIAGGLARKNPLRLLANMLPGSRGVLLDNSEKALAVARENVWRLGFADRLECVRADVRMPPAPALGSFDLIVSNPPYVPSGELALLDPSVRDYEQQEALDGGADGLDLYRAILENWIAALRPSGWLCFEVGEEQAKDVALLTRRALLRSVGTAKDSRGCDRVVYAKA